MPNTILNQMQEKMNTATQAFTRNLATVRAGRANPSLLDNVFVDYYGAPTPLNQLAQIGAPEARLLVITPFDKSSVGDIERAIQKRSEEHTSELQSRGHLVYRLLRER